MNRKSFEIGEMKEIVFARDGWCCRACGKTINGSHNQPQLAHGISKSKRNVAKYGVEVVHSVYNLYSACSLKCNHALAVGASREPTEAERIKGLL